MWLSQSAITKEWVEDMMLESRLGKAMHGERTPLLRMLHRGSSTILYVHIYDTRDEQLTRGRGITEYIYPYIRLLIVAV